MHLLVLGVILCGLYFFGQFRKNAKIVLPAVLIAFLASGILCVLFRPLMAEYDAPSLLGAFFVLGTTFYAVWRRFFSKVSQSSKKRL